jgi:hypothetical protein
MEFECTFIRTHETRTKEHKIGERTFKVGVSQTFKLDVPANFDFAAPEARKAFIAYVEAYADREQPAGSSEWKAPELRVAREKRPEPPFPVPFLKDGSLAELLTQTHARAYPTLYGWDKYTRYRMFDQWFMTLGNGYDWRDDGILVESGTLPETTADELKEQALRALQEPPTPEYLAELKEYEKGRHWLEMGPHPAVRLYPLSAPWCDIYQLPDNVEDSFLCAAADACRYFLSRPVWECCGYPSHHQKDQTIAIYQTGAWRDMVIQDGLIYRQKIEEVYAQIVERFRTRFDAMGCVIDAFERDMILPPEMVYPRWVSEA